MNLLCHWQKCSLDEVEVHQGRIVFCERGRNFFERCHAIMSVDGRAEETTMRFLSVECNEIGMRRVLYLQW